MTNPEKKCECANWTQVDEYQFRHYMLTGHHENCPHRPKSIDKACELISELAKGMERWAADEDGIHPDAWQAYRKAKFLEGVFLPEEE